MKFKKLYIFILMFVILSIFPCSFFNSKNSPEFILSKSASAGQIENQKDLINLLINAKNQEEREKILKDNSNLVNAELVFSMMSEAGKLYNIDRASSNYKKSQHMMEIAIETAGFAGDKVSLARALLYFTRFDIPDRKGYNSPSMEKAILLFKEAGDKKGEALCYYMEATYLWNYFPNANEEEKAFKLIDKTIDMFEEINEDLLKGYAYSIKGYLHYLLGHKDKAIENYKKSIEICEKEGDIFYILDCYEHMVDLYCRQGLFNEAEASMEMEKVFIDKLNTHDVRLYKEIENGYFIPILNRFPDDKDKCLEHYYDSLGNLYIRMGKYEQAIKVYKKLAEKGNKLSHLSEDEVYFRSGDIYALLGQKDIALKYYLEALNLSKDLFKICSNYGRLGNFYLYDMKNPDEGMKYFKMILEKSGESASLKENYKFKCYQYFTEVFEEKGEYDKAIGNIEEMVRILGDGPYISSYLRKLGELYTKKGDTKKAIDIINKAIEMDKSYSYPASYLPLDYIILGNIYVKDENLSEAVRAYLECIKFGEEINSISLWEYYFSLGKVYEKQGNLLEAFNGYNKSIKLIENMRQEFKLEELKRDFMQDKIKVYEHMLELLIKMKKYREAFEYNEKARSRAFLDILANQKIDLHHGIKPELAMKEDELKTRIQYLSCDIKMEKRKQPNPQRTAFIEESSKNLQNLKLEYEQVLEQIKMDHPEYMTFISVTPFSLEEIKTWLDKDTVIMEYFLGENKTFLWITGSDSFNTVIIDRPGHDIEQLVREYREYACDNITPEKLKSNKWKEVSEKLYDILFKEGEKYLSNKSRIIISPHRILHYLPFQVLIDNKGTTLVEKYDITYLPSSSTLKYCKDKNTLKKDRLLAFEPGNFTTGNFSPLPGTEEEVKAISVYFREKEIYSGPAMKTDILYEKGGDFDILHFATHGSLDSASPLFSFLVFSDRSLPVYEIFDLNLNACLVCLSACKTGLGEEANGDELVGLTRAFIYAGTPTICSSLWDVSDVSTSKLMERFYFHLKNTDKAEAMRLAQLDIKKKYSHPFFWAPFVLTGDWR